jgi:hypothetical protein
VCQLRYTLGKRNRALPDENVFKLAQRIPAARDEHGVAELLNRDDEGVTDEVLPGVVLPLPLRGRGQPANATVPKPDPDPRCASRDTSTASRT